MQRAMIISSAYASFSDFLHIELPAHERVHISLSDRKLL